MSLDLGALVGEVLLETASFDRAYIRVVRQMADLGTQAKQSAAGVATIDESLAGLAGAADTAGTAVTRVARATSTGTASQERAARAAGQHAAAVARVTATMDSLAGATKREQAATLRALTAQERYDQVLASGTASTRQLAGAQAGLITAQRSVTAAQEASATAATRSGHAMGGLLHTVRDLGLVFGGIEIAKQAIEFVGAGKELTTALNGVQAASHATNGEMAAVRAQAVALGKDMTVPAATAVDAADAIQDLVRSGMKLPRAMAAARPALLLASAAQVSTADSARVLGDVLDDFALPASEASHVANSLAGAATSAGGGLMDMFEAMKYVGPSARVVGVGVDDVSASIAELAKSGIQGSMAGTGLRMMLQSLAKGSPAAKAALHDLGIEAWDSQGRFVGLRNLYGQLHTAQERMGTDSKRFLGDITTAFGARASTTVAVFAHRGIEGFDQFAARVGSGDVQHYADLMNRGVSASMKQIRKEFTAAGIDVYQKLEPAFASFAGWLGDELPRAGSAASAVLGGPLHAAWEGLSTVVGVVGDVLKPVIHLLDSPIGAAGAQTLLAMWAAWKGYTIAVAAGRAVRDAMIGMQVNALNGVRSFQAYGAGVRETLSGNSTQAAVTSRVMQAEFAQIEAAALQEAAAVDQAAAQQAEAYATLVAASDDATATMIANSQNTAAAAEAQAAASAEAAATAAAAADAAAADVTAAGEASAVGWSAILGPVGLVAVGLTAAASAFGLFGRSAKSNAADVDALTAAIERDNGALGANTRQTVAHALATSGALDAAHTLGLSMGDITTAALQGGPALDVINQALGLYMAGSVGATHDTSAHAAAARKLWAALNGQNSSVSAAARHAREEAAATGHSTDASHANTTARHANTSATSNNAAAVRKLIAAELGLISASLAQAQSQDQFLESVRATTTQLKGNSGTLSKNTANGLANRDALLSSVQAALSLKAAQDKAGGSTVAHTRTLADNIASLRKAAIAAGADKGEVDKLLTSLHATPKEIRSTIKVKDQATPVINNVHDAINNIPATKNIVITATNDVGQAVHDAVNDIPSTVSGGGRRASGGPIFGRGSATSDSIPIMASNGEHMISAAEVQGLGGHGAVAAIRAAGRAGEHVPGFARGGPVGVAQQVSSALSAAFGFNRNQVAGFLGNFQVESSMDPTRVNHRENAHGLAQWEGSRWTALQAYAKSIGASAHSAHAQIGFLVKELRGSSGLVGQIKKMNDPAKIAAVVDKKYERSAGTTRAPREAAARAFARSGAVAAGTAAGAAGNGEPLPGRITIRHGKVPTRITHSGGDWIYDGIRYATERAALNARTRAEKHGGKTRYIYNGITYSSLTAAENAQVRAGKQAQKAAGEVRTKDLPAFVRALLGTTANLRSAEQALTKATREAGLTHRALARVAAAEKHLNALSVQRNRIAGQLGTPTSTRQTAYERLEAAQANYKGEHDNVAGNIRGGFDLAQAGRSSGTGVTLASILGDAAQQKANAELFNKQLAKLKSMGLGKEELQQLAEKGFAGAESSTLALLGGSRAQLRQLNGSVAGLNSAAGQTGTFAARLMYGHDVETAQQRVNRLKGQEARIDKSMERIGNHIANTIRRGLGMPVPGQHPAAHHPARHPIHRGWADHPPHVPTHLHIHDTDGKLLGTLRVEAQKAAANHNRQVARAVHHRAGRPS